MEKKEEEKGQKTYSCSESEFQIISTEGIIVDSRIDDFLDQFIVTEKVLCDTQPKTEKLITKKHISQ